MFTSCLFTTLAFHLPGVSEVDKLLSVLPKLEALDLSYNRLSVATRNGGHNLNLNLYELRLASCNLTLIPGFLRAMNNLKILDLSRNHIWGDIPAWAGEIGGNNLTYLDLSDNSITGFPEFKSDGLQHLSLHSNLIQDSFPPWIYNRKHLRFLDISNNSIYQPFPLLICNMSSLKFLDMSSNSFHGVIPQCFGNFTSSLPWINLADNQFHGTIPHVYGYCGVLDVLILSYNKFEGEVPSSLAKCDSLKMLDLGHNQLNGTFPRWIANLQKLQFLLLRSNNLHGSIETTTIPEFLFPSLRVFDVSDNEFVGRLPGKYFESFNAIKDVPISIRLVTIVDLSSNRFEGEIPDAVGNLRSLLVLNLSNNNLNGQIPGDVGNMINLEVLDLSRNQLVGEIPQSLAALNFLSFLNLSQNHLMGRIPTGTQLQSINKDLYSGNPGLCGPPLTGQCEDLINSPPAEGGARWINIESVMSGLAFGTVVGMVLGYHMLSTGRPKWVSAIADAGTRMSPRSTQKKRRHVHTRKRN